MKVLVTGGAGFIGSHLCERLSADPTITGISVIDDLSSGREDQLDPDTVDLTRASILDPDALASAIDGCQAVVHLAALGSVPGSVLDPHRTHEVNVSGSLHVLEAARRVGAHVVLASSSAVYGAGPELPKHEGMRPETLSPYAASKLAMEAYGTSFAHAYGLAVLTLRFFNVYGPRQRPDHAYAAVVPAFVEAARTGQPLKIHGDGTQTRDFTYVGSMTDLIARAVRGRVTGGPVNAAFGSRHSINELVATMESLIGRPLTLEYGPDRAGDIKHSQASHDRLRQLLPDLNPVALQDGLARTLEWSHDVGTSRS